MRTSSSAGARGIFDGKTTTTDDNARLDIKAKRFWAARFNKTYFDVKIFNCPESTNEDTAEYHESIRMDQC